MSKGPGKLQRDILTAVGSRKGATLESLRWEMWPNPVAPSAKLPNSWNSSFSRAVDSLHQRGHLQVLERPLADLKEWQSHYPGKALSQSTRQLRLKLLPVLVDWIKSGDGPNPSYSPAENERHATTLLDKPQMMALGARWQQIERQLRSLMATSSSNNLFLLLARGKQLFESASIKTSHSIRDLRDICDARNLLPPGLFQQLGSFIEDFLPEVDAGALGLKSYIRAIANGIPDHGHCELGREAIDALYQRERVYLEGLVGFQPAPPKKTPDFFLEDRGPRHSPMLKKVIDQSTFHNFRFLTVN